MSASPAVTRSTNIANGPVILASVTWSTLLIVPYAGQ